MSIRKNDSLNLLNNFLFALPNVEMNEDARFILQPGFFNQYFGNELMNRFFLKNFSGWSDNGPRQKLDVAKKCLWQVTNLLDIKIQAIYLKLVELTNSSHLRQSGGSVEPVVRLIFILIANKRIIARSNN